MWPFDKKRNKPRKKYTQSESAGKVYSKEEKIKILQEYSKIGAPIAMFCKWYGIGIGTFNSWQQRLKLHGEDGLEDNRGGKPPQMVPEAVKAEIIKLKIENPAMGAKKIGDFLMRNKFVHVSRSSIEKIIYEDPQTANLVQKKRMIFGNSGKDPVSFERSKPGEMYQMDIMTFHLKGLYKTYVIACLDDYSRFVVSIGVFRNQTADRVLDVLKSAIEKYGMPQEVLTDNGRQFYTWRGRSEFQKYVQKSGIRHIRSRPYHPQTLGKVESLWRNMYQELLSKETIASFEEMQEKIGKWVEWYNYKRPHQGINGMTPSDRFFNVENGVREMMQKGSVMVKESLLLDPRKIKEPTYLVGRIDGKDIRVIAKEGSVMVEGFEKKETGVNENGGNNQAAGFGAGAENAGQILPGNTAGVEIPVRDDGDGEKEESEGSMRGAEYHEGNVQGVEENGDRGHGKGVFEPGKERPEAEELRGGRGDEGNPGGHDSQGKETADAAADAGSGKEKSENGTEDGEARDSVS